MSIRRPPPVLTLLAALMLAVVSVFSAAAMAPQPPQDASITAFLAAGGDPADLCGDEGHHPGGHCPFCRLLSDLPDYGPAQRLLILRLDARFRLLAQQFAPPQSGHPHLPARAPPRAFV